MAIRDMYRIGVVGIGFMGRKHLTIINQFEELKLVGVCDTNKEKTQDLSVYSTTKLEELLDQGLDILVVSTPNFLHAEHSIKALERGVHVICEKPLAIYAHDASKMMEVAQQHQSKLFCMFQNRYSPITQWLKSIIVEGRLGEIFWVQVNCFWNRDQRYYAPSPWKGKLRLDGGVLFTQFSHFIDILIYLWGPLTTIEYAKFWNFNHQGMIEFEDSGTAHFVLNHRVKVGFHYTISSYEKNLESSITIFGEKGTVKIGGQYMNEVLACQIKDYVMPNLEPMPPANDYPTGYQGSASNHKWVYEEFLSVLKGNEPKVFNAMDAYHNVHLIEEVYKWRT